MASWAGTASTERFMAGLPLAQTQVDYDAPSRQDEGLVQRLLEDARTRVLFVKDGLVGVRPQEELPGALICADDPAAHRPDAGSPAAPLTLALLPATRLGEDALAPGCIAIYLGIDRTSTPETPYLALDITRSASAAPPAAHMAADNELGSWGREPVAVRLARELDWIDLRSFAPVATPLEAGLATSAVSVAVWHAQQRFCPACGAPVRPIWSGWAQTCTGTQDEGRLLFPRIEPAVITAIVDERDRLLLQNNSAWRPGFFSVSAGFVEAGESLEHAVRREALEEVGVRLGELGYLGSQAWPFPASIMLGFWGRVLDPQVKVDGDEVSSARWFTRDELRAAVDAGELDLPGRASIARHMIEAWYGDAL